MNNSNGLFYKILPFFSGILLIFWLYELRENLRLGNSARVKLDIALCLAFGFGLIGSIVLRIIAKKQ